MGLKGKYTSIYDVIERVKRSGLSDFTEEEAKEWTWEAVSLLGVPSALVSKVAVIPVEHARASLPYDLSDITEGGIRDYYTKNVLIKEGNIFHNPDTVGENPFINNLNFEAPSVVYVDGVPVDEGKGFLTITPNEVFNTEDLTYRINNGFIETGFKTGVIELAYKAFPVDNDNCPMIEDDAKTIRFVAAYISKRVVDRMWLRDEISENKKRSFDKDYHFAAASCRSNSTIGSIDDWEAIRARTNRLYRDPNLHKTGFKGHGNNEGLNL